MDKNDMKSYIARRAAKELKDGYVVNLGIGIPTLVPSFLPEGIHVVLQSENGIIGMGQKPEGKDAMPIYITDAGGQPAMVGHGGCYVDSTVSFGLIRGGHVDCTILGSLEVDQEGSLSNWIIPGKRAPGMGGAMDLVNGARRVLIAMEHTAKGAHKILEKCRLPFTGVKCVQMIITEMAVMRVTDRGLVLAEYNPEYSIGQIKQATGCELIIAEDFCEMA